jgi:uncharacterized protein YjbI with pentapeptide repeats
MPALGRWFLRSRVTVALLAACLFFGLLGVLPSVRSWAAGCPTVSETGVVTPVPGPGANLAGCDLTNAILTGADLSNAILTDATLTGANFTGALIYETRIGTAGAALGYTGEGDGHIGDLAVVNADDVGSAALVIPAGIIGRDVTSIADNAFVGSTITSISLGSVRSIGRTAFDGVKSLTGNLIIPDSVTSIGDSAFYGTSGLTGSLTLGSALVSIGPSAFSGAQLTGALAIPASVTSIGEEAFADNRFTSLAFADGSGLSTIPARMVQDVNTFTGNLTIPGGVTAIEESAFERSGFTGSLTIPSAVTRIGNNAFKNTGFTSVDLGSGLVSIGSDAFESTNLAGPLALPATLKTLGARAFTDVRGITSVNLPAGLMRIGTEAFSVAESLGGDLVLPANLTSLGSSAFSRTSVSGDITIPRAITTIGDSTFAGTRVSSVRFLSAVTSIGNNAFADSSLQSATFPSSLTTIGNNAFASRRNPAGTFTFEGAAPTFGTDAFKDADGITVRYPRDAAGWVSVRALNPNPFGLNVTWVPITPPSPAPVPSPDSPGVPDNGAPGPPMVVPSPGQGASTEGLPTQPLPEAKPIPTELRPGSGQLLIDGVAVPVTLSESEGDRRLTLSGAGISMSLDARGPGGRAIPLSPDGSLVLARGGSVPVTGSGFAPDSTVVLYLFSTPRELVTATANAAGAIATTALVPRDLPIGRHTLQIAGLTSGGLPLNLSLGLTVATPAAARGSDPRIVVSRNRVKIGARIPVTVEGAQASCRSGLWIKGSRASVQVNKSGKAQAVLVAPKQPGLWVITATIRGTGCLPVIAKRKITVVGTR